MAKEKYRTSITCWRSSNLFGFRKLPFSEFRVDFLWYQFDVLGVATRTGTRALKYQLGIVRTLEPEPTGSESRPAEIDLRGTSATWSAPATSGPASRHTIHSVVQELQWRFVLSPENIGDRIHERTESTIRVDWNRAAMMASCRRFQTGQTEEIAT